MIYVFNKNKQRNKQTKNTHFSVHLLQKSTLMALLQTNIFENVFCKEQSRFSQLLAWRKTSRKQNKYYSVTELFFNDFKNDSKPMKYRYDKVYMWQ